VRDADPDAKFVVPERGLLIADTIAEPKAIEARIAFSRRVGRLVEDGEFEEEHLARLQKGTYRVRVYGEAGEEEERAIISTIASRVGGKVSLESPDSEVTAYVDGGGAETYLAISSPKSMRQDWSKRRPRSRAFFHPSAIFPKLSRALVNFSGVQAGGDFLDPFSGTGSLLIEASIIGAEPVGVDVARKMVRGARRNALKYGQPWLGVVRGDSRSLPIRQVDAIATDIPYGRASSAGGVESSELLSSLTRVAADVLPSGGKLVVMHPKSLEVGPLVRSGELRVEEELDIYMHSKLTRTISVMRREAA